MSPMVFDFESFKSRHIGPDAEETAAMLKVVGAPSLDALIGAITPTSSSRDEVRRVVVGILDELGADDPLAARSRTKLASALY